MANLYLFRHGETTHNQNKLFTGWYNETEFTSLGLLQNQHLANLLKTTRLDLAFQTSLKRSQETLKTVLQYHPECTDLRTDDQLIERNYGILNNSPHADLIASQGQAEFDRIHRGWEDKLEGGESFVDVGARVWEFIHQLKADFASKDQNIAISAHGNSLRLFRHIMENSTPEVTCSWVIPFATVFVYRI